MRRWVRIAAVVMSLLVFGFSMSHVTSDRGLVYELRHFVPGGERDYYTEWSMRVRSGIFEIEYLRLRPTADMMEEFDNPPAGYSFAHWGYDAPPLRASGWAERLGFALQHEEAAAGDPLKASSTRISFPVFLPVILSLILPIWFYAALRRAAKRPATACPQCHYDLREIESGRCPECGAAFDRETLGKSKTKTVTLFEIEFPAGHEAIAPERKQALLSEGLQQAAKKHPLLRPGVGMVGVVVVGVIVYGMVAYLFSEVVAVGVTFIVVLLGFLLSMRLYRWYAKRVLTPLFSELIGRELSQIKEAGGESGGA